MLKNVQYGLGFLIGFFAAIIAAIGLIVSIESLLAHALPYKVPLALALSIAIGVIAARWIGSFDLSRFFAAREREPKPATPAAAAHPRPPRKRRPWSFHLIGTLILFWFLSLVAIIVLFGPFGFADDPRMGIRLLKMFVTTVAIAGLGAFLLRKELTKLMSPTKK